MYVNIVTEKDNWIFNRMAKEILSNCDGRLSNFIDPSADINYFMNYGYFSPVDTLKVAFYTHFDSNLNLVWKVSEKNVDLGLYMAKRYEPNVKFRQQLIPAGLDIFDRKKVCVGVIGRRYKSGRKGDSDLRKILKSTSYIHWLFVGDDSWESLRDYLNSNSNMEVVDYIDDKVSLFNYKKMDFILCMSKIEGGPVPLLEGAKLGIKLITRDIGNSEIWGRYGDVEFIDSYKDVINYLNIKLNNKFDSNILRNITWDRFGNENIIYMNKLIEGKYIERCADVNDLTVVIPVFNQKFYLKRCIDSLSNITSIIIVDDCSTDLETRKYLKDISENEGRIKVIWNGRNLGFAKSCNRGFSKVKTDFVCFLNSDIEVPVSQSEWWDDCVSRLMVCPEIGIIGVRLLFDNCKIQHGGSMIDWSGDFIPRHRWVGEAGFYNGYCKVQEVDFVTGACMVMRSDDFEKAGKFQTCYGRGYYEDCDLCCSILKLGKKVVYDGSVWLYHYHNKSFFGNSSEEGIYRNHLIFKKRNLSFLKYIYGINKHGSKLGKRKNN